jgi:hypothetical protein
MTTTEPSVSPDRHLAAKDDLERQVHRTHAQVDAMIAQWSPEYVHTTFRARKTDVRAQVHVLRGLLLAWAVMYGNATIPDAADALGVPLADFLAF